MDVILDIKNVTKIFPGVKALDKVSIQIERGEVHAIVGENGAGKSTLMKVLGGLYKMDDGSIKMNGKELRLSHPMDSLKQGISIVYQELNLISHLTVAENILIADLPSAAGVVQSRQMQKRCKDALKELNLELDPNMLVSELSVAQMQMVEIARAVVQDSQIVIMDEPTSPLNDDEVEAMFSIIRQLKANGKTIIYISHRMKEIFEISDRITILRDGKKVNTINTCDVTETELVCQMVGRDIESFYHREEAESTATQEVKLSVRGLEKNGLFKDISFDLHKGEILGLGGLMGCHREEIAKALFGAIKPDSGSVYLDGREIHNSSPQKAIRNKIMFSTDDRKKEGIFPYMSVKENTTVAVLEKICGCRGGGLVKTAKEFEILDYYSNYMKIKYSSIYQKLVNLSGGNQQKVLLARALASGCEVLILLEPTRGIDVGAKSEIYLLLRQLASSGLAILMVSSETNEMLTLCDRIIVIFQGEIYGELVADRYSEANMTEENLVMCATGVKKLMYCEENDNNEVS